MQVSVFNFESPVPCIQLKIENRDLHRTIIGLVFISNVSFSTQNSLSENSLWFGYANLHCIIDVSDDSIAVSPIGSHERYQSGLRPDARNFANSFTYWICLWFSLPFMEPIWDFPATARVWVWISCTHTCLDCLSRRVRMVYKHEWLCHECL
jgi:hypothetical protein